MTDPLIETLKGRQERVEREVEGLKRLLEGDDSIGYTGLRLKVDRLAEKSEENREMLRSLQDSEKRREEREKALVGAEDERKKDRRKFYFLLAGSLATGIIGIAINFFQTLVLS